MIFLHRKVRRNVETKAKEAEMLKASIIDSPNQVSIEVERLNKLIRSNGFALKIAVGMRGKQ